MFDRVAGRLPGGSWFADGPLPGLASGFYCHNVQDVGSIRFIGWMGSVGFLRCIGIIGSTGTIGFVGFRVYRVRFVIGGSGFRVWCLELRGARFKLTFVKGFCDCC